MSKSEKQIKEGRVMLNVVSKTLTQLNITIIKT